jgi:hypothetical protein
MRRIQRGRRGYGPEAVVALGVADLHGKIWKRP